MSAANPRLVRFIVSKFRGRCYWCNGTIDAGVSVAFYVEEKQIAQTTCDQEVRR